ncbi:bifunctional methylenetetrahydrofolate dehydrogenase/methenyltetrahydrofolate cyclohydrolase, partial [Bacillus vallismortis]|nr:bifunctional methylenetetrahydrofolate dehydrogenase/methenyltetrahydrofolate cyclohydrolase [Bacillus vallismortis]
SLTEAELLSIIDQYKQDPEFHGILVPLPLPDHISEKAVIERISPDKDVDGFHPLNVGKLLLGEDPFLPCTPPGSVALWKT